MVGASVVIALDTPAEGRSRLGGGLDVWYQLQWYTQESKRFEGEFWVWGEEHPAWNYGPAFHVWRVGGHWYSSAGARFGVAWPLRVGIGHGWWPGPGLTAEAGLMLSTSGLAGLDLQGVVDAPWVQARVGTALGLGGPPASRVHLGLFTPVHQPENWDNTTGDVWREPE